MPRNISFGLMPLSQLSVHCVEGFWPSQVVREDVRQRNDPRAGILRTMLHGRSAPAASSNPRRTAEFAS